MTELQLTVGGEVLNGEDLLIAPLCFLPHPLRESALGALLFPWDLSSGSASGLSAWPGLFRVRAGFLDSWPS